MGLLSDDDKMAEKLKWLARMKKSDPRHASLYCNACVKYLGAFGKECDCVSG